MYPYIQPNMQQYGQQIVNPYMERLQAQYQQMVAPSGLPGKVVDNFDQVTANDVPMDGRFSTFVKSDMSEIELRQWNSNGTIGKVTYKPVAGSNNEATPPDLNSIIAMLDGIVGRFDVLEKSIDKLSRPTARAKKEE